MGRKRKVEPVLELPNESSSDEGPLELGACVEESDDEGPPRVEDNRL